MNSTSGPGAIPNQAGEPVAGPTVFISHASQDHAVAEQICRLLEEDGIRCWIAPRNVDPGHDYAEQILAGIASTRVMVLLLSSHANASGFVKSEVERAISKGKVVIPLRIEEVQPSGSLELFVSRSQWIDAWAPPLHSRVHVLAAAIRGLLALPPLQGDKADAGTRMAPAIPGANLAPVTLAAARRPRDCRGNRGAGRRGPPGQPPVDEPRRLDHIRAPRQGRLRQVRGNRVDGRRPWLAERSGPQERARPGSWRLGQHRGRRDCRAVRPRHRKVPARRDPWAGREAWP